jgi:hypothetical protein|tara:strand:- start:127 stop:669 length:543 start_codon:yes stop_codon:yes gene_type:complete
MLSTQLQYQSVMKNCKSLFNKKMQDYGSSWRIMRLTSLTDQIFIKAQRIRGLQTKITRKVDEGEIPEFIGIINYSIMALIQIELGVSENPDLDLDEALNYYETQEKIIFELMLAKNHDYGEAWRDMRVSSLTDLILQKLMRVKQIEANSGKTIVSEGIEANYHDIVNYAVFALIHLNDFD